MLRLGGVRKVLPVWKTNLGATEPERKDHHADGTEDIHSRAEERGHYLLLETTHELMVRDEVIEGVRNEVM